jgi:hypothetical protein
VLVGSILELATAQAHALRLKGSKVRGGGERERERETERVGGEEEERQGWPLLTVSCREHQTSTSTFFPPHFHPNQQPIPSILKSAKGSRQLVGCRGVAHGGFSGELNQVGSTGLWIKGERNPPFLYKLLHLLAPIFCMITVYRRKIISFLLYPACNLCCLYLTMHP